MWRVFLRSARSWGHKGCFSVNSMREFADLPLKARHAVIGFNSLEGVFIGLALKMDSKSTIERLRRRGGNSRQRAYPGSRDATHSAIQMTIAVVTFSNV